jgi:hypothetical protein
MPSKRAVRRSKSRAVRSAKNLAAQRRPWARLTSAVFHMCLSYLDCKALRLGVQNTCVAWRNMGRNVGPARLMMVSGAPAALSRPILHELALAGMLGTIQCVHLSWAELPHVYSLLQQPHVIFARATKLRLVPPQLPESWSACQGETARMLTKCFPSIRDLRLIVPSGTTPGGVYEMTAALAGLPLQALLIDTHSISTGPCYQAERLVPCRPGRFALGMQALTRLVLGACLERIDTVLEHRGHSLHHLEVAVPGTAGPARPMSGGAGCESETPAVANGASAVASPARTE